MRSWKIKFTRVLKNEVFVFLILRYLGFGIQMVNSVLFAKFLNVYLFGIYSFLMLVLQYLSYSNLGINYSYSVLAAGVDKNERNKISNSAIGLTFGISAVLAVVYILVSLNIKSDKYNFDRYFMYLLVVILLQHFNSTLSNIYRVYGRIFEINIMTLIIPFIQFVALFFYERENVIEIILISIILGNAISLFIFYNRKPSQINFFSHFDRSISRNLIKRGLLLLFYNLTFYGQIMAAKTYVSYYYSVDEFAIFNFSNTISSAIFLLLGSLNFLYYPKFINGIANKQGSDLKTYVRRIRNLYICATLAIVYLTLVFVPFFYSYVPTFKSSLPSFLILLLAQIFINVTFGFTTLLVQKKKEKYLIMCALISIISIIAVSHTLTFKYKSLEGVAIAVVIGSIIYSLLVIIKGQFYLGEKVSAINIANEFNWTYFLPIGFFAILYIFDCNYYFNLLISGSLFTVLNYTLIKEAKILVVNILLNRKGSFRI